MRYPRTRKAWAVWLSVAAIAVVSLATRPLRAQERDESPAADSGAASSAIDTPTARKNPDGTFSFDPNDPDILRADWLIRRNGGVGPERTLPEWCYSTPEFNPDDMPGTWVGPPPPTGDGSCLGERVAEPVLWWSRLSYSSMWADGYRVPALATTSPAGTAQGAAGVLPAATVLFGDSMVADGQRSGGQIKIGRWLVDGQFMAIEGDYWALGRETTHFRDSSSFQNNDPNAHILARPFFNASLGQQDAAVLAFPNFSRPGAIVNLDGSIDIEAASNVQSAGMTFRHIVWGDFERDFRLDVFGGYRFVQFDESLQVRDATLDPGGGLIGPTLRESTDIFDARNDFHGGEVGLSLELYRHRFAFEFMAKVGLGNNRQTVTIDGNTRIESLGAVAIESGGLLALPTNIGEYRRDVFMAIPEGSATVRYALLDNLELGVGFRIMYLDHIVRPGDQIDTTINDSQIGGALVGPARPTNTFIDTDVLMRGLEVSLEYRW